MPETVREQLERLPVPPESPTFFDELWQRAEVQERAAARRWRRTSIVLAALVVAAAAAAGVLALGRGGHTIDATYACATGQLGGEFKVSPGVSAGRHESAGDVWSGAQMLLEYSSWTQKPNQWTFDAAHCRETTRAIPLAASGLSAARSIHSEKCTVQHLRGHASSICDGGRIATTGYECVVGQQVLLRVRIAFDRSGGPTRSALAIRGAATGKPIAYFAATPPYGLKGYVSRACRPH